MVMTPGGKSLNYFGQVMLTPEGKFLYLLRIMMLTAVGKSLNYLSRVVDPSSLDQNYL